MRKKTNEVDANAVASATVRALAHAQHVTVDELAEISGLGRAAMFTRLNGTRAWRLNEIVAVAAHLDVPVQALISGEVSLRPPTALK